MYHNLTDMVRLVTLDKVAKALGCGSLDLLRPGIAARAAGGRKRATQ